MATNQNLKKAHAAEEYTPEMVMELKRCRDDPVHFINNYIKTQHPTRGNVPFKLFEYQERFIRCLQNNRFIISLQSRQMGKTLTCAIFLLWYATFHSDSTLLIASKNMSHALEIASRIRFAYEEMPSWIKCGVKYYNRKTIEFDNGSRIICEATTEKTGRGLSITKIFLDELAFISPRIQTELWASLTPTLSTGGSAIISSTPNGDTELFAQLWRESIANGMDQVGPNGYRPFRVYWDEHPERDESYYKMMQAQLGELATRQEVACLSSQTPINSSLGNLTMEELYSAIGEREICSSKN